MSQFTEYLHEVFETFGRVEFRRMFSGQGMFHQDLMIALVIGDTVYLKADELTAPLFEQHGQHRFSYLRKGEPAYLPYYTAPVDVLENRDVACLWAQRAYEAALRARARARKPAAKKLAAKKPAAIKTAAKKIAQKNAAGSRTPPKPARKRSAAS